MGALLSKAIKMAGSPISKLFFGSGIQRIATGTLVGGIAGAALSSNQSSTGVFQSAIQGAGIGLGIGTATTKTFLGGLTSRLMPAAKGAFRAGWGAAKFGGKLGIGSARFTLDNPRLALAAAGTGLGMYTLASSGPSNSRLSTSDMANVSKARGTSYRDAQSTFMNSTHGLVQGLNAGRHG